MPCQVLAFENRCKITKKNRNGKEKDGISFKDRIEIKELEIVKTLSLYSLLIKKMILSVYPTLTTDYQTVAKNYPTLHPTLEPTLYPTLEGKRTTDFFAEQSGRAERTNFNHGFHEFNEFSSAASGRLAFLCSTGIKSLRFRTQKSMVYMS